MEACPGDSETERKTDLIIQITPRIIEDNYSGIEKSPRHKDAEEGKDYDLNNMTWMWDKTTIADKRIIENNQKGVLSKKYEPGPLSEMENALESFKNWYLKRLLQVI